MNLDNLTAEELDCYEEWNCADERGGDCSTFGFSWAAFHVYGGDSNYPTGGIVLIANDQGSVEAWTYDNRAEYDLHVEALQEATKTYQCAYCKEETDNSDLLCDACDAENAEPNPHEEEMHTASEAMREATINGCPQCVSVRVNGVFVHEYGCPIESRWVRVGKAYDGWEER